MIRLLGRPSSISARLTLLNVLVSGIALLLAFVSFVAYDAAGSRKDLENSLHTEAQILGANVVSALLFDDRQSATTTLSALRGSPSVISSVVLGPDGQPFAEYVRDRGAHLLNISPIAAGASDEHWSQGNQLLYGSRIVFQGHRLGSIYLLAATDAQTRRSREYAVIAAMVLLLCMGTALLLTSTFRHLLTDPLIALAQTAQVVREQKDYSLRVNTSISRRDDELALLVRSFNEMLDDIQERDKALEHSRNALEERVQQRTSELSAANKELEAFSYTVAHDLRGPLDTIANLVFLLGQIYNEDRDEEGREFLREVQDNTKKMSILILDLLNLSRANRTSFRRELIDMSEIVASIMKELIASERERKIDIRIAPGVTILADRGLMYVAMENLLRNSWKYTSQRSFAEIEFGRTVSGGKTTFFVRDNGAGFDPAYADRLFQPFQRLHAQNEFPGTGIGLATVYRIIKRHGGEIWADGRVGEGATFYFTVPYTPIDQS